jgi:hypothetical protein
MGGGIDWTGLARRAIPSGGRRSKSSGEGMREAMLPANRWVGLLYAVFILGCWVFVHPIIGLIALVACGRRLADKSLDRPYVPRYHEVTPNERETDEHDGLGSRRGI